MSENPIIKDLEDFGNRANRLRLEVLEYQQRRRVKRCVKAIEYYVGETGDSNFLVKSHPAELRLHFLVTVNLPWGSLPVLARIHEITTEKEHKFPPRSYQVATLTNEVRPRLLKTASFADAEKIGTILEPEMNSYPMGSVELGILTRLLEKGPWYPPTTREYQDKAYVLPA